MKSIYGKYFKIGIVFWAVCFVLLLLAYLFVLSPQEKYRRTTARKLKDTKNLAQSVREAADEKNKQKLNELLTKSGNELKNFVIDGENAESLPLNIGRMPDDVRLNGFNSNYTSVEQTTRADNYNHIIPRQISVNFYSSFNDFAFFLNTIERRRPVIFVDTFSISRSAENDSNNEVNVRLAFLVGKKAET